MAKKRRHRSSIASRSMTAMPTRKRKPSVKLADGDRLSYQLDGSAKVMKATGGMTVYNANGTTDEYIPIDFENAIPGTLEGASIDGIVNNICGNLALSAQVHEATLLPGSEEEALANYCNLTTEEERSWLYCFRGLCWENTYTPSAPDSCPCPVNDGSLAWDSDRSRWVGLHPGCGCSKPWNLELWFDNGWKWACVENEAGSDPGNIIAQGNAASVSCSPFQIEIQWFTTSVSRTFNIVVTPC